VTGAARGLGNVIALALAHAGADVALGLRDPASSADLADRIGGMGRRALRLPMDVRDLDQVRPAVDSTVGQLGRLDILFNYARLGPANPAEEVTEVGFDLTRGRQR
jgi:NAD(P)-dependent dehydrogenase (short-subunit alcohol dehydrogenase family)